jgi:putative heme-binding domain-containing protein
LKTWSLLCALCVLSGEISAADPAKTLFASACSSCHGTSGEGGRGPNLVDGRIVRRLTDDQMSVSIQRGVPGTEMIAFPFPDEQIRELVQYIRSLSAPAYETPLPGDPQAGAALFYGKANCTQCHAIAGRGGLLGPDLSSIGLQRSAKRLREAVLNPSIRLAEGFQPATVTTSDGRTLRGLAKNRTNYSLQLQDPEGRVHLLRQTDWRKVELSLDSPMPSDYARRLTAAEIDDLLAFLSRQAAARRD